MRPQSFHNQMPPGRPFNQFQGPRGNFGGRPPRFPQPGMMPPPGRGPAPGPGMGPELAQEEVHQNYNRLWILPIDF